MILSRHKSASKSVQPSKELETASKSKIFLSPNKFGAIYIIALIAMIAGASNYNSNMAFVFAFLLSAIALASIGHTYRNLSGIQIRSIGAKAVFAGDYAEFVLHVHNTGKLKYAVRFELSKEAYAVENLPENADLRIRVKIRAPLRGIMRFNALQVQSAFPLGLLQARTKMSIDANCLIYPRPVYGAMPHPEAIGADGEQSETKFIAGADDFYELKTYQPGDSPRHISWKAYSRGQGLFTKTFAAPGGTSIIADWDQIHESDTEAKLSRLCGVLMQAHRLGRRCGLAIPGKAIAPSSGKLHFHACLKQLALYGISDHVDAS